MSSTARLYMKLDGSDDRVVVIRWNHIAADRMFEEDPVSNAMRGFKQVQPIELCK